MNVHVKWVSFYFLQKCYHFLFQRYRLEHYTVSSNWLALSAVVVFTVMSLSRSVALFRGVCAHRHHSPQHQCRVTKAARWMKLDFSFLCLQATTPLWTCTQSSIASPRIRLFTQSLKADLLVCVWAKSGTASQAASFYRTSQYAGFLHRSLMSNKVWKVYFVISRCDW